MTRWMASSWVSLMWRSLGHVHRHAQRGRAGALADPGLQHPEPTLLDRELGVAHVAVVPLEPVEDVDELAMDLGERELQVVEVLGVADARHHILALCVDQEVAVRLLLTRGRVAGEGDARARVVVAVAEHHRLDVHGRAELVADPLADPVGDGALARSSCGRRPRLRPSAAPVAAGGTPCAVVGVDHVLVRPRTALGARPRAPRHRSSTPAWAFAFSNGSSKRWASRPSTMRPYIEMNRRYES